MANKIAKERFMDYPDYDSDNPIDNLPDALCILLHDCTNAAKDTKDRICSADLYDYLKSIIH